MHHLIEVWFHWVLTGGYAAVFWLMALESTIIPIPSEVVIPPAAIVAATQQGSGMSLVGVVIAGTLGSWFGSAIMYWVARWLGRPAILRWGKYVFVPPEKLARAEVFLRRYEAGGIFFARLLPVIRHLISIPAGIVRMGFLKFSVMTIVGSALWCGVLAWFGQTVITPEMLRDPEGLATALKAKSHVIAAAVIVLCLLYFLVLRLTAHRNGTRP